MSRTAERMHTDQAEIARLERLVAALPDEAIVELALDDGRRLVGTVSVRPTVQVFFDADGNEGMNALLRLDDAEAPEHPHYVWLDRVVEITRRGTS